MSPGARRAPPVDQSVRQPRSASKRSALVINKYCQLPGAKPLDPTRGLTGWLISYVTSFVRYKISYTQTILVIMAFRDCNSNIFIDFKRFLESKTWNCVLYGEFYEEKMCLSTQRKSRIRAHCFSNHLSRVFFLGKIGSHIFLEHSKFVEI